MRRAITRLAIAWAALVLLVMANWGLAYLPLSAWHMPIALLIALAMAATLASLCMRITRAPPLSLIFALGGIAWFAVMLALGETDYQTRPPISPDPSGLTASPPANDRP